MAYPRQPWPFQRPLSEAAAVLGWRFADDFAERRGKCARLPEAHVESDFRHRQVALCQQALGAFDATAGEIAMRRHAERLLERTREMVRAELHQLGQGQECDILGKMLVDV